MGKSNRKFKKNIQKKQDEERNKVMNDELEQIEKLIDEEKYADALNEMPKLAEMHCKEPRFLYDAAYCYFMTGDYDRAVNWLNNTLSADTANVKARVLLARICLLEDRENDALAIFDLVLGSFAGSLTAEDKEELEEILDYYVSNEADMIQKEYPHIAEFFKLNKDTAVEAEPKEEKKMPEDKKNVEEDQVTKGQKIVSDIMDRDISLQEKVRILNFFAGSYYMSLQYELARVLLEAAVRIDTQNEHTLRNMAFLLLAEGRTDEAIEWAARLPIADFWLLYTLQCNG